MYNNIIEIFEAFRKQEIENLLFETFRYVDLLTQGAITEIDRQIPEVAKLKAATIAKKRKEEIPIEYIVGMAPFLGEWFYCSPATFIPRKETELLANATLSFIQEMKKTNKHLRIVDIGTGCGNIAISLTLNCEDTSFLALDLGPASIELAKKNVHKFGLEDRIHVYLGDLFAPITGRGYEGQIDIVVCNPPYIPKSSIKKMPKKIIENEPLAAFEAGPYGIDFFRRLISESLLFLKPDGILVFEIGAGQENLVTRLFNMKKGYEDIRYYKDGDQVRVMSASRKSAE